MFAHAFAFSRVPDASIANLWQASAFPVWHVIVEADRAFTMIRQALASASVKVFALWTVVSWSEDAHALLVIEVAVNTIGVTV